MPVGCPTKFIEVDTIQRCIRPEKGGLHPLRQRGLSLQDDVDQMIKRDRAIASPVNRDVAAAASKLQTP